MRRRLDLAVSLIAIPPVIFLDEPTTGLDPRSRLAMWEIIRGLMSQGTTILLTTQYLEEADQLADQIAVIDGGVVIAEGTAEELKRKVGIDRLEITFKTDKELNSAVKVLSVDKKHIDTPEKTVSISIDDINHDVRTALDKLEKNKINISGMAVKQPTLDDVFLTLTGKQKAVEEEDK
jgi:ABC-2 type transport system ATP-binding protein